MTVPCVERRPPGHPLISSTILDGKMEDRGISPVLHFQTTIVLVTAEFPDQREQRQVHGNDHAAHDDDQKNDHDGIESSQKVLHCHVYFVLVEIRNLLQHGVHRA